MTVDRLLIHTMLALCLFGCGEGNKQDGPAAMHPRLGKVLELPSIGEAAVIRRRASAAAFGELSTPEGSKRPRSCVEWEILHAAHAEPTNDVEAASDQLAGQRCDALQWLTRAQPSARSYVAWNDDLAKQLPAIVATAWDDEARAAREGKTLHDYAPNAAAQWSDDQITISEPGGTTKVVLRPIAWADLNSDGIEDLLLAVSNLDSAGPMTQQRVLALTRDSDQQPLREISSTQTNAVIP